MLAIALSSLLAYATPVDRYMDAQDYFAVPPGKSALTLDAYAAATDRLSREFADVCGDTFCEGDESQLTPLSLTCSVGRSTYVIGQCLWTFAGLESEVDPVSGRVVVKSRFHACDLAVHGSATDLAGFLTQVVHPNAATKGPALTSLSLPGTSRTLYDVLTECL